MKRVTLVKLFVSDHDEALEFYTRPAAAAASRSSTPAAATGASAPRPSGSGASHRTGFRISPSATPSTPRATPSGPAGAGSGWPPQSAPGFTVIADPQGATFAAFEGETES